MHMCFFFRFFEHPPLGDCGGLRLHCGSGNALINQEGESHCLDLLQSTTTAKTAASFKTLQTCCLDTAVWLAGCAMVGQGFSPARRVAITQTCHVPLRGFPPHPPRLPPPTPPLLPATHLPITICQVGGPRRPCNAHPDSETVWLPSLFSLPGSGLSARLRRLSIIVALQMSGAARYMKASFGIANTLV